MLRPQLVFNWSRSFWTLLSLLLSLLLLLSLRLKRLGVFYTSAIPEVTWYKPLHNTRLPSRIVELLAEYVLSLSLSLLLLLLGSFLTATTNQSFFMYELSHSYIKKDCVCVCVCVCDSVSDWSENIFMTSYFFPLVFVPGVVAWSQLNFGLSLQYELFWLLRRLPTGYDAFLMKISTHKTFFIELLE